MWSRTYGGAGLDVVRSVVEASDGGYAIAGWTESFGAGGADFWLVKTDGAGNMLWNKTYGGAGYDYAFSMITTSDGGYAIAGTYNVLLDAIGDFWLVKTDASGNMEWNRTYDGAWDDIAFSVVATSDGGYALAGTRNAYLSLVSPTDTDVWLVKTDAFGNMEWNKSYGGETLGYGTGYEWAYSLVATSDGGYAIAGTTTSFGAGSYDFWLVKTDASGNMEWNRTYGGSGNERAYSLVAASDGGYALAGGSMLIKTDAFGNMEWNQTYVDCSANSLIATSDGGYAIAGWAESFGGNSSLVKIDSNGVIEWHQTYEGSHTLLGVGVFGAICSLVTTADGGYAIASSTSYEVEDHDFLLVKTDEFGVVPEYSSLLVPALVLAATALIIINKKKLLQKRSKKL